MRLLYKSSIRLLFSFCLIFPLLLCSPLVVTAANEEAIFAGGCFWCLEHDLEELPGVSSVESGYSGGTSSSPTYRNHFGHQESVRVKFDSQKISYPTLLRGFWRNIDPLDNGGQFCDRGESYKPVIFTKDQYQEQEVENSLDSAASELGVSRDQLKVNIEPAKVFWIAEDYHQNYAELNSLKYSFYRFNCGRDRRLNELWGDNAGRTATWAD